MSTIPSEPIDVTSEMETFCHWGIRVAWYLSLLWGGLVLLLSWTGGAAAAIAVIRGLVAFLAIGLVGWGVNAVMVHAGAQDAQTTSASADALEGSETQEPGPGRYGNDGDRRGRACRRDLVRVGARVRDRRLGGEANGRDNFKDGYKTDLGAV